MWKGYSWVLLGGSWLCSAAYADDLWASRGQLGFAKTGGNTDTTTGNFLVHIAHLNSDWKYLFGAEGLYGSTQGETTAQAWSVHLQANYNITERLYWYGGLGYVDDKFSGFVYQETLATGAGYQFVKTRATKLAGQIGIGARRLRPEILVKDEVGGIVSATEQEGSSDAVLDAAATYEHAFNDSTKLLAAAALESGKENTLSKGSIGLQVKMTDKLGLSAGIQGTHNSKPPAGAKPTDTLTTLNLVYEIKNPKLAPE
jgi:putative salt-induced outer membrane protein